MNQNQMNSPLMNKPIADFREDFKKHLHNIVDAGMIAHTQGLKNQLPIERNLIAKVPRRGFCRVIYNFLVGENVSIPALMYGYGEILEDSFTFRVILTRCADFPDGCLLTIPLNSCSIYWYVDYSQFENVALYIVKARQINDDLIKRQAVAQKSMSPEEIEQLKANKQYIDIPDEEVEQFEREIDEMIVADDIPDNVKHDIETKMELIDQELESNNLKKNE